MAKKMSLDKDKIKAFFILHSEKIVCVLFVGLMVMLCWKAYGLEMYKQTPEELARKTLETDERVQRSKFDPVTSNVVVLDYPAAVNQRRGAILSDQYATIAWCPPVHLYKVRRMEPAFLPLEELVADTGYGAIAYGGDGPGDAGPGSAIGMVRGIRPPPNAQIRGEYWVSLRGLIPVGKQQDLYDQVFSNAMMRDEAKDSPEYVDVEGIVIERAEGIDPPQEKDWVKININDVLNNTLRKWAQTYPEMADPTLVDPVLGEPLPPLVGKNFDPSTVIHEPQIGIAVKKDPGQEPESKQAPAAVGADDDRPRGFGRAKRGAPKAAPVEGNVLNENQPKKKVVPYRLFRFFDFSVVPGKVYRYRVRLALYNPNFGIDPRYLKIRKEGETSIGDGEERQTPWSEASNPVTLPRDYEILAGQVYKPKSELKEMQATLIIREWDASQAVDAVHEFNKDVPRTNINDVKPEIQRGTLLNIKTPVLVDKPGSKPVTEEVSFHTDELVVDMSGADYMPAPNVPGVASRRLKAPSEILFLQPNGELVIRDLASDAEDYDRLKKQAEELASGPAVPPTPTQEPGAALKKPAGVNIFELGPKKK